MASPELLYHLLWVPNTPSAPFWIVFFFLINKLSLNFPNLCHLFPVGECLVHCPSLKMVLGMNCCKMCLANGNSDTSSFGVATINHNMHSFLKGTKQKQREYFSSLTLSKPRNSLSSLWKEMFRTNLKILCFSTAAWKACFIFQNRLSDAFIMRRVFQQRQLQIVPLPFKEVSFFAHHWKGFTSRRWQRRGSAGWCRSVALWCWKKGIDLKTSILIFFRCKLYGLEQTAESLCSFRFHIW